MVEPVRVESVEPSAVAAVQTSATRQTIGDVIARGLEQVWSALRAQNAPAGHNIVIYRGGLETMEVGVEVPSGFEPTGSVQLVHTPAGEAAVATHWGDYGRLMEAYTAIESWCAANGRRPGEVSWEVYGHWDDDPSNRRTDVYFALAPA